MKQTISIFIRLLLGAWLIGLSGCATTGGNHVKKLSIPPGLDSTTVVLSIETANNNFVSAQKEGEANVFSQKGKKRLDQVDEFCTFLEQDIKNQKSLSSADKKQFDREMNLGSQNLSQWKKLTNNGTRELRAKEALTYCQQAQQHLEAAVKINPFDKNARVLLAVAYYNLQHIFGIEKNYEKAIEILERLTRIEKGEHELFRLLAENQLAVKNFEQALLNFQQAQKVLLKTSFETPPDTSKLFYYMYAQGDAYARMYDDTRSLKAFQVAEPFVRTPQEKTDLENYVKWIQWDDGNIRASELFDKILALESEKNYDAMAQACESLLNMLQTRKAKMSVFHKLAVVEFEILGKKAQAVERMKLVYETLDYENFGMTAKEIQPFFDSYGAMLYRLGIEARDKQEKKLALAYFTKAASFKWDQGAKAHIELVSLLWNDPDQAIFHGKKALADSNGLSEDETNELLSLMVRAHKSAGLYDEAREYFNKWKQTRSKQ
ncbi:MAG: tetratricopeptide repeat protein [Candidatus Zhuqueibacterota bacterium]